MATGLGTPTPVEESAASGVEQRAGSRSLALDNLKVLLIAGVIVAHSIVSYVAADLWPYGNVTETELSDVTFIALSAFLLPFGLFLMALLFLVAGLLTPGSVERKGPRRYAIDRLLRLGVPFVVMTQVLWPVAIYAVYRPFGHVHRGYWTEFVGNYPDMGVYWFIGVLLIFSLGYAWWWHVRPPRPPSRPRRPITVRHLLVLAGAIAVLSFPIRLAWPYAGQTFTDLNEWQWPECAALFTLGLLGARRGWARRVPDPLPRQSGIVTLIALVACPVAVLTSVVTGGEPDDFLGGSSWAAFAFPVLEGALTVFGSIWLLSWAQRHLDRRFRCAPQAARAAFAAFLVHAFIVLALAVALRPLPLPAELKALALASAAVAASFWLGWLLVTRVPMLRRAL